MSKKKKIIIAVCLIALAAICFRIYSTQCVWYQRISGEGVVEEVYHRSRSRPAEPIKKAIDLLKYPPEYNVTIKYDGIAYTVDDELIYNKLKESEGEKAKIEVNLEKLRNGDYVRTVIAIDDIRCNWSVTR